MKFKKITAAGAAIALSASLALAVNPAFAADYYVVDSELGAEGSSYPSGWFVGDPAPSTAPASQDDGILLSGRVQLLHNSSHPGSQLGDLINGAGVSTVSGNVRFQIPMWLDAAKSEFTTLRPVANNTVSPSGDWQVSRAFGSITANTGYPLADILAQLSDDVEILGYGVYVAPGQEAVLASITWGGDTTYFSERPSGGPADPIPGDANYAG